MARVYFGPNAAIKYVGAKPKEFTHSLARPKPVLKKGDIVIVNKRTAFNQVKKGFGNFTEVDEISFVKADKDTASKLQELEEKLADSIDLEKHTEVLKENQELIKENESLKNSKTYFEDKHIPVLESFKDDKDKLEEFARGKGIELDKRYSIEKMYASMIVQVYDLELDVEEETIDEGSTSEDVNTEDNGK